MRHRNHSKRLSQKPHHARLIQRNLVTSLLLYERVRTTKKRASVVRPLVEHVLTIGKTARPDLAIRRINEVVTDRNACRKILEVFKDRYKTRSGGYTRMVPVGMRGGDGAKLVDLMLVDGVGIDTGKPAQKKEKTKNPKRRVKTPSVSAA